jgi:hypothetical protein
MKRVSLIGPLLLICVGVLFLANNLRPDLPTFKILAEWWPFLLIAWGAGRIIEITIWWQSGKALPPNGISGGEWFFVVILCVAGTTAFYGQRFRSRLPAVHVTGLEMLGESFGYQHAEKRMAVGKTPRVRIENSRGNARVNGGDSEELVVKGTSSVRAYSQSEADKANNEAQLEIVRQGDLIVVRSNQDRVSGAPRVSTDLDISVPKGASVECRGRFGDFDVTDVGGNLTVDSDNTGVRAGNIGGDVRIEARRSDILRILKAKGNVEIRGSGSDVELESVEGATVVNGNFHGELVFRNLAKSIRFDSSSTELRAAKVAGKLEMSRGHLTGDDITGPVYLHSRAKDVVLSGFTDALELQIEKGDVELRPGKLPVGKMDVRIRGGDVDLALPRDAKFELNASTERGEIDNRLGSSFRQDHSGKGGRLTGSTGAGPLISLRTDRGRIAVRTATADAANATLTVERQ